MSRPKKFNPSPEKKLAKPKKAEIANAKAKESKSHHQHCEEIQANVKKHGKSGGTNTKYDGHLRRAREWVKEYALEQARIEASWMENHGNEEEEPENGSSTFTKLSSEYATCLEGPPVECTPEAIVAFMHEKCFREDCGKSTASQIHAAFLRYYNTLLVYILLFSITVELLTTVIHQCRKQVS
jgi:hypothetical protein